MQIYLHLWITSTQTTWKLVGFMVPQLHIHCLLRQYSFKTPHMLLAGDFDFFYEQVTPSF